MSKHSLMLYHLAFGRYYHEIWGGGLDQKFDVYEEGGLFLMHHPLLRDEAERLTRLKGLSYMAYTITEVRAYQLQDMPEACERAGMFWHPGPITRDFCQPVKDMLVVDCYPA